jgi:hypothetical protein
MDDVYWVAVVSRHSDPWFSGPYKGVNASYQAASYADALNNTQPGVHAVVIGQR